MYQAQFTSSAQPNLTPGSQFSDCDFKHLHWQGIELRDMQFHNCRFYKNNWQDCDFSNCTFYGCEFKQHQWSGSLDRVKILSSIWPEAKLSWSHVDGCQFYQTICSNKAFPWESMHDTVFDACEMGELDLSQKQLTQLKFSRCQFDLLDLTGAQLDQVDFIESQCKKIMASGLKAEYLQMGRVQISEGDFTAANMAGGSIFHEAELKHCDFSKANLGMAMFAKAKLSDVCFHGAQLPGCNLEDAKLERVSFRDSKLANLYLSDTILHEVEGL